MAREEDPNKGCDLTCFPPLRPDPTGRYVYGFRFVPGAVERALENFPVEELNAHNKKLRALHTRDTICKVDFSLFPAQPIRIIQVYSKEYLENQRAHGSLVPDQPLQVIPIWSPRPQSLRNHTSNCSPIQPQNTEDARMD